MGRDKFAKIVAICLLIIQIIDIAHAVDRSRFKTCNQSGFCKRNRNFATQNDKESPYQLIESSILRTNGRYIAEIINRENKAKFLLVLSHYENGIVRVKINEKSALNTRYEVPDVLIDTIKRKEPTTNPNEELVFGKVKIQYTPFKLDFYSEDGEHVLSASNRGLFNIEHFRENTIKDEEPPVFEIAFDDQYKKISTENAWKESFSTHSDSKPKGPSSVSMDFTFVGSEAVYGIPEHASSFALKTTVGKTDPYRLYNLDVFEYELDETMALYGSIPLMLSHRQGKTTAIFWLNSSETWVDIDNTPIPNEKRVDTHWFSESGIVDFFVMFGPTPKDVLQQYKYLTGSAPIPPLFSIAYHQCRWNYRDQEDVVTVNEQFDVHDIPLDVIWLDIEHTDSKKYFTWDSRKFSAPKEMLDTVASTNRKMVTIVDPHIKKDDNYFIYREGKQNDYFVHNSDGSSTYEGWCWPGASMYLDFSSPDVRSWWSDQFNYEKYVGSTPSLYIWNDMNEPSVFNGPEVTMFKDLKHYQNVEHRDLHNLWGFWVHKATADGIVRRSGDLQTRPFVLSRAFFAGSQRFGAIWTGDNKADWGHLEASVPMLLSINIAGLSFSGADVGGFFGNPDTQLLVRWYQAGAFQPFFRGHAHIDTKRREPYLFGDEVTDLIRTAIRARYALLPYWYTQFYLDSATGAPVMRPLWFDYPNDQKTFLMEDEYLIGSDLLVKPVTQRDAKSVSVYFPGSEDWFDIFTYDRYSPSSFSTISTPLDKIPAYQRAGSIIPRKERARRSSSTMLHDPYTLVIALDSHDSASGLLYVDDFESLAYTSGAFTVKSFEFKSNVLSSKNSHSAYSVQVGIERIVILGSKKFTSAVFVDGETQTPIALFNDQVGKTVITTLKKPGDFSPLIDRDNWKIILN